MAGKIELLAVSLALFNLFIFSGTTGALAAGDGYGDPLQIREGRYFRVGVPRH